MSIRIPKTMIDFNPPVYMCKRATRPFVLDGNIEKEFWADAPFTGVFLDIEGSHMPTPRYVTRAKMLWDDENFYFGAVLEGDEIWGTLEERDSVIFLDNDFEIFIDPDSDTHAYYEFEMNAKNTVWDLLLTKPYRDGGKPVNAFDIQGMRTAVHIEGELNNPKADNKRWMIEVVMPFEVLKQCANPSRVPEFGEYWRVNFSRVQWQVDITEEGYTKRINPGTNKPYPEDNWVWAPTGVINIHYPELWGFVFFTDKEECYEIPECEKIKWELRRLYYNEHEHFDRYGKFTTNFEEMKGEWGYTIKPCIEMTKNSFEISALNEKGTQEISIFSDGRTVVRPVNT
ncbi:MAG: carbohydrate-binding family 9-like protein [Cellulosilyticaceae bacterium]